MLSHCQSGETRRGVIVNILVLLTSHYCPTCPLPHVRQAYHLPESGDKPTVNCGYQYFDVTSP
ncbi:hypothetical protein PGT21_006834 [Puccinia graminis f. sp. tritici]|uniref:Uncharacterized protein n=1 Tax=Puccinia graminis f. sp. tritici TaxID=56615 RepID=A0A5B0RC28_PUCGR|nr:hypothetical protein PGT21_006834 [Puccinia graminis f. sp. tritici]KAA1122868.1 hypothetical protein PGTUg99_005800 [Puccinia graminis f. sp. tritici]